MSWSFLIWWRLGDFPSHFARRDKLLVPNLVNNKREHPMDVLLCYLVEVRGLEPLASSMPWKRSPS